jgi:thioredoxin 1
MAPVLKDVASKMGEKAKIIKIDVDKNQKIANKLGIRGVPTFVIYKKGKIVWRQSGMQSPSTLMGELEKAQ